MKKLYIVILILLILCSSAHAGIDKRTINEDKMIYEVRITDMVFLGYGLKYAKVRWQEGKSSGRFLWLRISYYSTRFDKILGPFKLRLVY